MKISEQWLREWINPPLSLSDLCERLTMAGLEIEEAAPIAKEFKGVVIGKIIKTAKHPTADRLTVCEVDVGRSSPLQIVCGAKNAVAGIKVPAALAGAHLAELKIEETELRGVLSQGMLCSAKELGLADESDGLYIFNDDAPIGQNVWEYLQLADHVIEISITPNRGDCLSLLGLTREIAALTETEAKIPIIPPCIKTQNDKLSLEVKAPAECPHYAGRIIRGVKTDVPTPTWMKERLRRAGTRSIHFVVDVMNYVMYELGQPMHAFDLKTIEKGIRVRRAKAGEELTVLDGKHIALDNETLIIADQTKPLAIAGVMGGLDSSVTLLTEDIFLESAFFASSSVARMARKFNLSSESSYRFERGVDPSLQVQALERATHLILEYAGGKPSPIIESEDETYLPKPKQIRLRPARIKHMLGFELTEKEIQQLLKRFNFTVTKEKNALQVTVPARRFDIQLEVDLIEEIARLYGYEKIPEKKLMAGLCLHPKPETTLTLSEVRHFLCDVGYHEVVTYSFVDKNLLAKMDPYTQPKPLINPITAEMDVMRTTLWPGLINTLCYNQNRQQERLRIFETGLRFIPHDSGLEQQQVLAGLVSGNAFPLQWGIPARLADFFDVKGDLENLFRLTHAFSEFEFKKSEHPALHPGQTAVIYHAGKPVGILGELHPSLMQTFDIANKVYLFEINLQSLLTAKVPHFKEISKFPEIRRDIAILVNQSIPVSEIQYTIRLVAGELLQHLDVFDVYQGKGIAMDQKSIALALTIQHPSRTLVDEEINELMGRVIVALKERFAAELRG